MRVECLFVERKKKRAREGKSTERRQRNEDSKGIHANRPTPSASSASSSRGARGPRAGDSRMLGERTKATGVRTVMAMFSLWKTDVPSFPVSASRTLKFLLQKVVAVADLAADAPTRLADLAAENMALMREA